MQRYQKRSKWSQEEGAQINPKGGSNIYKQISEKGREHIVKSGAAHIIRRTNLKAISMNQ